MGQSRQYFRSKTSGIPVALFLLIFVMTIVTLPFLLAGDWFDSMGTTLIEASPGPVLLSGIIIIALTLDVLLPVPSSLVALAATVLLGGFLGFLTLFAGFMAGALFGYYLGYSFGRRALARFTHPKSRLHLRRIVRRTGPTTLLLCRPVPVLAETSVILAGVGKLSPSRFIILMLVANACLAAFYTTIGAMVGG